MPVFSPSIFVHRISQTHCQCFGNIVSVHVIKGHLLLLRAAHTVWNWSSKIFKWFFSVWALMIVISDIWLMDVEWAAVGNGNNRINIETITNGLQIFILLLASLVKSNRSERNQKQKKKKWEKKRANKEMIIYYYRIL